MSYRTYLLVYGHPASASAVKRFLDSRAEIVNWYTCLPNSFFLVTALSAKQVAALFRTFTEDRGRFIVVNAQDERGGWMPRAAWDMIAKPAPVENPTKVIPPTRRGKVART